jgi:hypothetical protein
MVLARHALAGFGQWIDLDLLEVAPKEVASSRRAAISAS